VGPSPSGYTVGWKHWPENGVGTRKAGAGMGVKQQKPAAGRKVTVLLIEEPEGGYSVEVPELPGCFTEGDTLEEALKNAKEAIECYLDPAEPSFARKVLVEEVEV
jgi:predicted RNase H-like HicB family nuclease